jgi:hypothetical protein
MRPGAEPLVNSSRIPATVISRPRELALQEQSLAGAWI